MTQPIIRLVAVGTAIVLLMLAPGSAQLGRPRSGEAPPAATAKNSWRGITPLHSSPADVARTLELEADQQDAAVAGPFKVDGGEVTFAFLTPKLAGIYRAPRSMAGKVFAIYFQPGDTVSRSDLRLPPAFKQCVEEANKTSYYLVSDAGVAYQFRRGTDVVERIIYQPTRVEISRLAVNTECVF